MATRVEKVLGAARVQPTVITTEDLRWADPSTLEVIELLGAVRTGFQELTGGSSVSRHGDHAMSESNKKLVTELVENLSGGRLDKAFEAVADNATWWVVGTAESYTKQEYRKLCADSFTIFRAPPLMIMKGIIAEGDRVALEVESDADLINGKHYHNYYHFLFVIRDGKVIEAKEYLDTKLVADSFGDLPVPRN